MQAAVHYNCKNHGSRNVRNGFSEKGELVKSSNPFQTPGSSPTPPGSPDFIVENHSSIFLVRPQNKQAVDWANVNIGSENGFQPCWPHAIVGFDVEFTRDAETGRFHHVVCPSEAAE
jgi:hypothetical protein